MKTDIKCPTCKKSNIVKRGTFETKAHGKQQRYYCKSCDKKFIVRTGFYRMRNNGKKITLSIDLFFRGISTRKIQEHLQTFYPHNSSHMSIYRWVIKYSKMISKFTDKLKLDVGSELQIDEQAHARLGERNWLIDSIDTKTRFVVASSFHESRGQKEIKEVLKNAKQKTLNQFEIVTSDGFTAYPRCIKKIFGYNNPKGKFNVFHNVVTGSKGEGFNVPIERFHNNVRDRTKIMRGFHGSVESADIILKGFVIFYNFITKHQGLECRPYEKACPELKDKLGLNKWLELINFAS